MPLCFVAVIVSLPHFRLGGTSLDDDDDDDDNAAKVDGDGC